MRTNNILNLFLFVFFLYSCSPYSSPVPRHDAPSGDFVAQPAESLGLLSVTSLMIMPVQFDEGVRSKEKYAESFYDALVNAFRAEVEMDVIVDKSLLERLKAAGGVSCLEAGRKAASSLGGDAVVCTTLHSFTERRGSSVGAESPAQINFTMQILRVSDGVPIWGGDFVFKDQALTENLFAIEQRVAERPSNPGWQSATSVLERGFREASADFARQRLAKFAPGRF